MPTSTARSVRSSVLWGAACSSAGNAAPSDALSPETPTSPSPTGTASPSADNGLVGLVYVNQEAGYTFHYPDDWVVVEGKGAGSVVVYAPPGDPRSSPANVSISLTPVPEGRISSPTTDRPSASSRRAGMNTRWAIRDAVNPQQCDQEANDER
jgi:PsbP